MFFNPISPGEPLHRRLKHTRTDAFLYEVQAQNKDDKSPFDFTGSTFLMHIKEFADDATEVVQIPDGNFRLSESTEGATAGVKDIFIIEHPAADFANMIAAPFEYYFDIQITDAAGFPYTPILGEFIIRPD